MEKTMTPEESLQIIQKTISRSRENMREESLHYIVWGWALVLGAFANYAVLKYFLVREVYAGLWWKSMLAWIVVMVPAFIITSIISSRREKNKMVKTHLNRYISNIWMSAGILYPVMVFFAFKLGTYPPPLILAVTALATFISGNIVRFTPLMVGGAVFLIASIAALYVMGPEQLMIFAGAMVLGFIVPGYMLRYSKNGSNV